MGACQGHLVEAATVTVESEGHSAAFITIWSKSGPTAMFLRCDKNALSCQVDGRRAMNKWCWGKSVILHVCTNIYFAVDGLSLAQLILVLSLVVLCNDLFVLVGSVLGRLL